MFHVLLTVEGYSLSLSSSLIRRRPAGFGGRRGQPG